MTPRRIACVACPTLFAKLQEIEPRASRIFLLEYDRRFAAYRSQFAFYDYSSPLVLPPELGLIPRQCRHCLRSCRVMMIPMSESRIKLIAVGACDLVVADPPFLSQECMEKTIQTVLTLSHTGRAIFCTGTHTRLCDWMDLSLLL